VRSVQVFAPFLPLPDSRQTHEGVVTVENAKERRRIAPIRVLVADDQPLYLETLELLLGVEDRIEIVGRAADGLEAIDLALSLHPDVVLMDVHMPRCDGVEAVRRLRVDRPALPIVMLSSSTAAEDLEQARAAGASSYLTKDSDGATIVAELARHAPATAPLTSRTAA
jgi:DNA-binding NarL/FixJ family response regulator